MFKKKTQKSKFKYSFYEQLSIFIFIKFHLTFKPHQIRMRIMFFKFKQTSCIFQIFLTFPSIVVVPVFLHVVHRLKVDGCLATTVFIPIRYNGQIENSLFLMDEFKFCKFCAFSFPYQTFSSLHKKGIRKRMRGRYYSNGYYDCVVVYYSGYLICY